MFEAHLLENGDLPEHRGDYMYSSNFIKTFHCDTFGSEKFSSYEIDGYLFCVHSVKRQLWSLQCGTVCVGIGDPFKNDQYVEFLRKLPRTVRLMLYTKFQEYGFTPNNALLFTCENVLQVVPIRNSEEFYLYLPGSKFMMSDPFRTSGLSAAEFLKDGILREFGSRITQWLGNSLNYLQKRRKELENARKAFYE